MVTHYLPLPRTTPSRSRERMRYDRDTVHAILDEALVCHVGFVVDGKPVVLPTLHVRVGERLYLHGSTGSRLLLGAAGDGIDVCVTVTLIDGLVIAKSAFHHSVNYRSVVAHGRARLVSDDLEKRRVLTALVNRVDDRRSEACRPPSAKELAATAVLRLDLVEVSAKTRAGGPVEDPADVALPFWSGVIPLTLQRGTPVPADAAMTG